MALLLKSKADRINKGVEQRDSALKSRGDGKLILPLSHLGRRRDRPMLALQIRAHNIEDRDIALIGGSNTGDREVSAAANSAALDLVG